MRKDNSTIIIRRQNRSSEQKHGGAWKVAFADFTLAMMAFFMVMWLMQITDEAERGRIAHYMRTHSIFDGSPSLFEPNNSPYPVDLGGSPSLLDHEAANRLPPDNPMSGMSEYPNVPNGKSNNQLGNGKSLSSVIDGNFNTPAELGMLLQHFQDIAEKLEAQQNVRVEVVPAGLRVIITDDNNHQMFVRGAKQMTPFFEDLFFSLGAVFKQVNNRLIISGHTDSANYKVVGYSNWELAAARALQARWVLEAGGMPSERVEQVISLSATKPLNVGDPLGSENRRVELLILTPSAQEQLDALFGPKADGSRAEAIENAAKAAEANQPVTRLSEMQ
ncbi:OmpA family protein [Shewanella sp. A25]|nr:OmpA family protein [Shewanella shenzhenensis]